MDYFQSWCNIFYMESTPLISCILTVALQKVLQSRSDIYIEDFIKFW